uniref:Sterile alpha motif domain-containing protein 9-like n=1 Tax=Salmo trutta TaxID=8032 RepID=A0A674BGH7_SALTR
MAGKVILTLPKAGGGGIPLESEFRDSLSFLDVLSANEFEGEQIEPAVALQTEADFYKGTPPNWINFYLADENANSYNSATPTEKGKAVGIIKREGYEELREQIMVLQQSHWSTTTINLQHETGSGGTTLAMQVLWDLRKQLRCTVLVNPSSDKTFNAKQAQKDLSLDTKAIAKQVIRLFEAGGPEKQNTVLLLQDNEHLNNSLQDILTREINEQKISAKFPVVIIIHCMRNVNLGENADGKTKEEERRHQNQEGTKTKEETKTKKGTKTTVILRTQLSDSEKVSFENKEEELRMYHGQKLIMYYSFNIMQSDFSKEYVRETLSSEKGMKIISFVKANKTSRKTKLFAFLVLLNSYVPGSYLLQSQCEAFLRHTDSLDVGGMQPFSDLMVAFSRKKGEDKHVHMAHSLIAHQCAELLADAGVTRSETILDFLKFVAKAQIQLSLFQYFKDMLTKRETTPKGQEKFSRLIQDIEDKEGVHTCLTVLKNASDTFMLDPFYPQALARFYYIKVRDYDKAEKEAIEAKRREPRNSFIADTLGQVHKNHLKTKPVSSCARNTLSYAEKAIKAFKQEEELAEKEKRTGLEHYSIFNNRGHFGFLQVANTVFYSLTKITQTWKNLLTQKTSAEHLPQLFKDRKIEKYKPLLASLRDDVERKWEFFERYLTYSEPSNLRDQPPYFERDINDCYANYMSTPRLFHAQKPGGVQFQKLQEKKASTFPGLLSCVNQNTSKSELRHITELWRTIYDQKEKSGNVNIVCNYILANIIQTNGPVTFPEPTILPQLRAILQKFMKEDKRELWTPEFYLLVLLLFWPEEAREEDGTNDIDFNMYVGLMKRAYNNKYKKYLRSRELVSLFYLGKGDGLRRLVFKFKINNQCEQSETEENPGQSFQSQLLRVNGVVREHKAFVHIADKEIEICPKKQASVWKDGNISFYLGFNISGPVAFDIKYTMRTVGSGANVQKQMDDAIGSEETRIEESKTLNQGIPMGCKTCRHIQDSTNWLQVRPSVSMEGGEKMYRHQSPKGCYECTVSGLRWVCESNVILKYHYRNWEPYSQLLKRIQSTQGGPLLDITMEFGELEEVHLPHFICLGTNPSLGNDMKILHVEEHGVSFEEVHEVTRFHVKLLRPKFSSISLTFPFFWDVEVHCNVVLYLAVKEETLISRLYLLLRNSSQQEAVQKEEEDQMSKGYSKFLLSSPNGPLKLKSHFALQNPHAKSIKPQKIQLLPEDIEPSRFKMVMDNTGIDIQMALIGDDGNTVWDDILSKEPNPKMLTSVS